MEAIMPNSVTKSVIGIVAVAGTLAVGIGTIGRAVAQSAVEQNQAQAQRGLTNRYEGESSEIDRLTDYQQLRRVFIPGFSHPLR
jgi:hypothetical protein